eukprot:gene1498-885_t
MLLFVEKINNNNNNNVQTLNDVSLNNAFLLLCVLFIYLFIFYFSWNKQQQKRASSENKIFAVRRLGKLLLIPVLCLVLLRLHTHTNNNNNKSKYCALGEGCSAVCSHFGRLVCTLK